MEFQAQGKGKATWQKNSQELQYTQKPKEQSGYWGK